jgi:NAD(P)H-dependent FMN reductase
MSHIAIISGSHRPAGNSPRIARHIEKQLQGQGHTTYLLDLAITDLPFWDEGMWGAEGLSTKWETLWKPIAAELTKAYGFVIVSPEYHGMVPSKLMNLFLLVGNGPIVAHKPALAVTVSAGTGGSYPITELRAFSAKNNRMVYLPEHLIIRSAGEMFIENVKPEHADSNTYVSDRLTWLLAMLKDYAEAFKTIRAGGNTSNPKYANGM